MNFEKEKNPYIHTVYYTGFFFQSPCMQFNAAWVSYLLNIFFVQGLVHKLRFCYLPTYKALEYKVSHNAPS